MRTTSGLFIFLLISGLLFSRSLTAQRGFGVGYGACWFVPGLGTVQAAVTNFTESATAQQQFGDLVEKDLLINLHHGPVVGYYSTKKKTGFSIHFSSLRNKYLAVRESPQSGKTYYGIKMTYNQLAFGLNRNLSGNSTGNRVGFEATIGFYRIYARYGSEEVYNKGWSKSNSVKIFNIGCNLYAQIYTGPRLMFRPYYHFVLLNGQTGDVNAYGLPPNAIVNPAHVGLQLVFQFRKRF